MPSSWRITASGRFRRCGQRDTGTAAIGQRLALEPFHPDRKSRCKCVIPAQAGTQAAWVPAYAGMTRRTRSSQGVNALKLTHYHGGYRNIDDTRRYDSCGLAASNRSIGSHTNAVCTTCRPANWIAASAAGLPPSRW